MDGCLGSGGEEGSSGERRSMAYIYMLYTVCMYVSRWMYNGGMVREGSEISNRVCRAENVSTSDELRDTHTPPVHSDLLPPLPQAIMSPPCLCEISIWHPHSKYPFTTSFLNLDLLLQRGGFTSSKRFPSGNHSMTIPCLSFWAHQPSQRQRLVPFLPTSLPYVTAYRIVSCLLI